MNFIPDQKEAQKVPYFEDASKDDGWQGHATEKSTEKLMNEVSQAIGRLGGFVSGFQRGVFNTGGVDRHGFQVYYSIGGKPSRMDIAALPTRTRGKVEKSIRMALFMLRNALDGMWFFQQLSPGYAPLMPFMIVENGKTVSQLWAESSVMSNLLPPPSSDFEEDTVEGEVTE